MKLVKVKDIFLVKYGTNLELNKLEITTPQEGIPFVSRTSKNNGVSAYVGKIDNIQENPAHTLSVAGGGSVLATFYQSSPYYSGRDLYYLNPINTLSKVEMLIYCTFISSNKYRYSFGRQANKTLEDIKIPHPDEVREIASQFKPPQAPSKKSENSSKLSLYNRDWSWFFYEDIFKINKGKRLTKSNMQDGMTPFIGAIDSNNGVSEYINKKPIFNSNTITVSYNGSVAEAFYQPNEYWASDDINVLINDSALNIFVGMFLTTLIKKEKYRFNYGRKWHKARMEKSKIKLPVDTEGDPDWQFMEDYIKSLPYSANL